MSEPVVLHPVHRKRHPYIARAKCLGQPIRIIYPADMRDPSQPGKLRLMYEATPMAMIVEQAGGAATDGFGRIMEINPTKLHQRVPVYLGSKEEVEIVTSYHAQ